MVSTQGDDVLIRLNATADQATREIERFDRQLARTTGRVDRNTKRIESDFRRTETAIARSFRGLLPVLSGVALVQGARRAIEFGDSIGVVSDRLGVGAELLQEWRFAAEETSNVLANQADTALQRFVRRVGEAQQGYGVLLPVLEQYNIALRENDGTLRSAIDVYRDWSDAVADIADSQEQLRVAVSAFDQEGGALVNLVREGAEGFDRYAAAAREAGILTNEQVREAQSLDSELTSLTQTLKTDLTSAFLDLSPIITGVTTLISDAAGAIRGIIGAVGDFNAGVQGIFMSTAAGGRDEPFFESLVGPIDDAQALLDAGGTVSEAAALIEEGVRRYTDATGQLMDARTAVRLFHQGFEDLGDLPVRLESFLNPAPVLPADVAGGGAGGDPFDASRALFAQTEALRLRTAALLELTPVEQRYAEVIGDLNREFIEAGGILDAENANFNADIAQIFVRVEQEANNTAAAIDLVNEAIGDLPPSAEVGQIAMENFERIVEALGLSAEESATALENLEALIAGEDVGGALSEIEQLGLHAGQSIANAFGDAILRGEELSDVLSGLAQDLARLVLQQTVLQPLAGGIGNVISGLFHEGGIVGDGGPSRGVSPLTFVGAPRMHAGGIAGLMPNEVPAILQRGELVLSRQQQQGLGGVNITVAPNITIEGGAVGSNGNLKPEAGAQLGREVERLVTGAVNQALAKQTRVGGMLNRI